jgi:iron-sulfur cluster assembly protein
VLGRNLALPLSAHEGFEKPAQNERYACHKVASGTRSPVRYHEPVATVEHPTETLISLTPVAAAKIRELMAEEDDAATLVLRVAIQGGGCSGFQYGLGFDAGAAEGDVELSLEGIPVVVDPFSAPYLRGTTIDFLNSISESGFKIDNPNAVSSCGCGHSFQVDEGEELPEGTAVGGCGSGCSH